MTRAITRLQSVDTLRGLALIGVLQINIQAFCWGSGNVLGYLGPNDGPASQAVYFLLSAFVEAKCYPILAFLFGFGLAHQWAQWQRDPEVNPQRARRRLWRRALSLGILGGLHGCLLYFGDVLLAYAGCAALLSLVIGQTTRYWVVLTRACAAGALVSVLAPVLLAQMDGADNSVAMGDLLDVHRIYSQAGWQDALAQRLDDEFWQQWGSVADFWPQVLCFMSVGVLAQRQGWLRHPGRHVRVYAWARRLGLGIGLPCALLGAALDWYFAVHRDGACPVWVQLPQGLGSLLSCAYVAWYVNAYTTVGHRRWQIPQPISALGRLSLTSYLGQSLAMNLLLSGWGLAWGWHANHAQLALLAGALVGAQALLAVWWLRYVAQGPLEALWRATYRGA